MPNIDSIAAAVYGKLSSDETLTAAASVYKGKKRPAGAKNPALTIDVRRLSRGEGEGMWICDIVITVYVDILANRTAHHEKHAAIGQAVRSILADTTLSIDTVQALPLIEGGAGALEWDRDHDN